MSIYIISKDKLYEHKSISEINPSAIHVVEQPGTGNLFLIPSPDCIVSDAIPLSFRNSPSKLDENLIGEWKQRLNSFIEHGYSLYEFDTLQDFGRFLQDRF